MKTQALLQRAREAAPAQKLVRAFVLSLGDELGDRRANLAVHRIPHSQPGQARTSRSQSQRSLSSEKPSRSGRRWNTSRTWASTSICGSAFMKRKPALAASRSVNTQVWRSRLQASQGENRTRAFVRVRLPARLRGARSRAQSFPEGDVFTPLVADPFETRSFLSVLSVDSDPVQSTFGSVGLGVNFGLYRWPGQQPGDGWQVGLFAPSTRCSTWKDLLSPREHRLPRRGPGRFRNGAFSGRARGVSSELASRRRASSYRKRPAACHPQRRDRRFHARMGAWRRGGYVGAGYVFHSDPSDLKSVGVQVGIDYIGTTRAFLGGTALSAASITSPSRRPTGAPA